MVQQEGVVDKQDKGGQGKGRCEGAGQVGPSAHVGLKKIKAMSSLCLIDQGLAFDDIVI